MTNLRDLGREMPISLGILIVLVVTLLL